MAESRSNRRKKIEALLAERKKFEAWLAQLDARREATPQQVFERVYADYAKRLEAVRAELTGEADGLKEMVDGLESRLGDELRAVNAKADERAEAELRAMVGEYSDKQWDVTRQELDDAIETLRSTHDGTETELSQLKDLLGTVRAAPPPVSAAPPARASTERAAVSPAEEAGGAAQDHPVAPAGDAGRARNRPTPAPRTAATQGDGRAPTPVRPAEQPAAQAGPVTSTNPDAPGSARRTSDGFDELAFLRSVAAPPTSPRGTATVSDPADATAPRRPIAEPSSRPREATKGEAAPEVAASPTVASPPPAPRVSRPIAQPQPQAQAAPVAPMPAPQPAPVPAPQAAPVPEPISGPQSLSPLGAPSARTSQASRTLKCQECGTLNFPTEWYCERCGGELAAF